MEDINKLHEKLYSLVINCDFIELKEIFIQLIENKDDLLKTYLEKFSFSLRDETDFIIGLICSGQKEIVELLFQFYPDSLLWTYYMYKINCRHPYFIEFLDFLIDNLNRSDYSYRETLMTKIKWFYYNREIDPIRAIVKELNGQYDCYFFTSKLEELWNKSIKAEQYAYSSLFLKILISFKNKEVEKINHYKIEQEKIKRKKIIERLIYKYIKGDNSINTYVYLYNEDLIKDKSVLVNPMTEDYFNQLNISDYQNLAQLESELRIPIKSLEFRYIRQLLQASIKGQHVLLTTQLTKLVIEVNEFDNKTLLESSNTDIIKRLSDLNLKLTIHHPIYFLNAISKCDNVLIDAYVLLGINVRRDYDEALIFATYHGHIKLVEKLIKLGCHIHTQNPVILTLTTSEPLMTFWLQHYDFPQPVIKYALLYHSLNTSGCYSLIKTLKNQLKSEKILKYSFVLNLEAKDYLTAHALVKEEGVDPGCLFSISQLYKEEFLRVNRCPSYHELSGEWKQIYDAIFANANHFAMPISKMFKNRILSLIQEKMK